MEISPVPEKPNALRKEKTLEKWIAGAVSATEAPALKQWLVPLEENAEAKNHLIYFTLGVIGFVSGKVRQLLSEKGDMQHAMQFTEEEGELMKQARTTEGLKETADWLQEAGATPTDIPTSLMLGLMNAQRRKAQLIVQQLRSLTSDERYREGLERKHTMEDVLNYTNRTQQRLDTMGMQGGRRHDQFKGMGED